MTTLVPELDVSDLEEALAFYVGVLGFSIRYDRTEERFAYLERKGAELMLEEAAGPGRRRVRQILAKERWPPRARANESCGQDTKGAVWSIFMKRARWKGVWCSGRFWPQQEPWK